MTSRVVAGKTLVVEGLKLAPLVKGVRRIVTSSRSPWALRATVTSTDRGCQPVKFLILETAELPRITEQAAAEASLMHQASSSGASAVAEEPEVISDHKWKQSSFPWPFWVVRRSDMYDECNCELKTVTVRAVHTFPWDKQLCKPFVDTIDVSVPLMVNFKPLDKGDELVVFWKSTGLKQVVKLSVTTWMNQATKNAKKSGSPSH
jgi:hypothetical protein